MSSRRRWEVKTVIIISSLSPSRRFVLVLEAEDARGFAPGKEAARAMSKPNMIGVLVMRRCFQRTIPPCADEVDGERDAYQNEGNS